MADSSSGVERSHENSNWANSDAQRLRGRRRSNSRPGDSTISGSPNQSRSRGDPASTSEDQRNPEKVNVIGGIASDYQGLTGTHCLNDGTEGGLRATGVPDDETYSHSDDSSRAVQHSWSMI